MSFSKADLISYIQKGLISGGIILGYDMFVENVSFSNNRLWLDAGSMVGSVASSKLLKDLVSTQFDLDSVQGKIIEPLITAFVYAYACKMFVNGRYPSSVRRDNYKNYLLGGGAYILSGYLENPLLALFGIKSV